MDKKTAIILISEEGLPLAHRLLPDFPQAVILSTTVKDNTCLNVESYANFFNENFHRYDAFIFIGAMGICVRSIAPFIADKHTDPAVVCIDSTGRYAIPVLSGHVGGANELARCVAGCIGAEAVITTQSDRTGLWALDTLGTEYNWTVLTAEGGNMISANSDEGHRIINRLISLFVKQVPTLLYIGVRVPGVERLEQTCPPHVSIRYGRFEDIDLKPYELVLLITPFRYDTAGIPALYYIPQVLHAGIGLAHNTGPVEEIIRQLDETLYSQHIHPAAISDFATICEKREEPVVGQLNLPRAK